MAPAPRRPPRPPPGMAAEPPRKLDRDPVDVRDLVYSPALTLLPEHFLAAALQPSARLGGKPLLKRRNQGNHGTCIGQALAAVIDIQRIEAAMKRPDDDALRYVQPASADMLYVMALAAQGMRITAPGQEGAIQSLRTGLKGFYNSGVCTEQIWGNRSSQGDFRFDLADVEVMKQARNVTLGAYYRVRPVINDYHAALNEAGALYVSAETHEGWNPGNLRNGAIVPPVGSPSAGGGHAFAVVGYGREGFYVLNSWGETWGQVPSPLDRAALPGVALWRYEDWAASLLDGWVLRLAVPTPGAFRFTIGEHGLASFAGQVARPPGAGQARHLDIVGRYAHLDDGRHVEAGSLPSSDRSFRTTLRHIGRAGAKGRLDRHGHVLLVLHGDVSPTAEVLARTAREFDRDGEGPAGIFRFAIAWANDLLAGASEALHPLFQAAQERSRGNVADGDRRIEETTRPVGKALWRDLQRAAAEAAGRGGAARRILAGFVDHCSRHGRKLHIVSEGAGIQLLAPLLAPFGRARAGGDLASVLASLHLVAPLMTCATFERTILPFLAHWLVSGKRAVIVNPDAEFDRRLAIGLYSGPWRQLVARAFEEDAAEAMLSGPANVAGPPPPRPAHWPIEAEELVAPADPAGPLGLDQLFRHRELDRRIREAIHASASPLTPG